MANDARTETKKRLLLSKWRGYAVKAIAAECAARLLDQVETFNARIAVMDERDAEIKRLGADLEEARDALERHDAETDERFDQLEGVLVDVKYWLHEGLVMHRIVSDPRAMLRKIEDVIG